MVEYIPMKTEPVQTPMMQETIEVSRSGVTDSIMIRRFSWTNLIPLRRKVYSERRRSINPPMVETIRLAMATNNVTPMPA